MTDVLHRNFFNTRVNFRTVRYRVLFIYGLLRNFCLLSSDASRYKYDTWYTLVHNRRDARDVHNGISYFGTVACLNPKPSHFCCFASPIHVVYVSFHVGNRIADDRYKITASNASLSSANTNRRYRPISSILKKLCRPVARDENGCITSFFLGGTMLHVPELVRQTMLL